MSDARTTASAYLIHRPDVPDTYDDEIANLGEWLDLASFILSDIVEDPTPSERGRRGLYNHILKCVAELERPASLYCRASWKRRNRGCPIGRWSLSR